MYTCTVLAGEGGGFDRTSRTPPPSLRACIESQTSQTLNYAAKSSERRSLSCNRVRSVGRITYIVLVQTLNHAQSINQSPVVVVHVPRDAMTLHPIIPDDSECPTIFAKSQNCPWHASSGV